jgi:transposase-like protein
MHGHGEKLSRNKEKAIAALLSHATIQEAATAVGVNESTLRRWLKEPDFLAEYREARRQVYQHATATLQRATPEAVATLLACLKADSENVRLRAAALILEHAHKGIELEDLEVRLTALAEEIENLKELSSAGQRNGHQPGVRYGR